MGGIVLDDLKSFPVEVQQTFGFELHLVQRGEMPNSVKALIHAIQPDISKLKKGYLDGFTIDHLCSFLRRLNRNIEIRVTKSRGKMGKMGIVAA